MADITHDQPLRFIGEKVAEIETADSEEQEFFKGTPVFIDTSETDDKVRVFDSGVTLASDDVTIGIAAEGLDMDGAEEEELAVYVYPTIIGMKESAIDDSDRGEDVYMSDSGTLTTTKGSNLRLGKVHRSLNGYLYIQLDTPYINA